MPGKYLLFPSCRWFTFTQLDGSLRKFVEFGQTEGFKGLWQAWPQPSLEAWLIVLTFGLFEAVLQRYVPGKRFEGPVTPNGNTPVYKVPKLYTREFSFQDCIVCMTIAASALNAVSD